MSALCNLCFPTAIHYSTDGRLGTRFPQNPEAVLAEIVVGKQFVVALTVFEQTRFPDLEVERLRGHVLRDCNFAPKYCTVNAPMCAKRDIRNNAAHSPLFAQ